MSLMQKMQAMRSTVTRREEQGPAPGGGQTTFEPTFVDELDRWCWVRHGAEGAVTEYDALVTLDADSGRWMVNEVADNPDFEMDKEGSEPFVITSAPAQGHLRTIVTNGFRNEALIDGRDHFYVDRLDTYVYGVQARAKRPGVPSGDIVSAINARFAARADQRQRRQSRATRRFPSAGGRGAGQGG